MTGAGRERTGGFGYRNVESDVHCRIISWQLSTRCGRCALRRSDMIAGNFHLAALAGAAFRVLLVAKPPVRIWSRNSSGSNFLPTSKNAVADACPGPAQVVILRMSTDPVRGAEALALVRIASGDSHDRRL